MVLTQKQFPAAKPVVYATAKELMPGDVVLAQSGALLKTLLGSCVSVILTDPRRTVAAMCHIVHVGKPNAQNRSNAAYGPVAMEEMFTRLRSIGITPQRCQAYVFGGGNMFPGLFNDNHVGKTNAHWATQFLHGHGITVVDQCLGGTGYRKVSWTVGVAEPLVETVFPQRGAENVR
jgi:chemotaxis protein CheD